MTSTGTTNKIVAIVTGANQGLGYGLVWHLLCRLPKNSVVYLGARNHERGLAAVERLQSRLKESGNNSQLDRLRLLDIDVSYEASVAAAASLIAQTHCNNENKKNDLTFLLIHNAAARMSTTVSKADQVEGFIHTNNGGTHLMMRHFGPLMRQHSNHPRFVVVASSFGSLTKLPPQLHSLFDDDTLTLDHLDKIMDNYVAHVKESTDETAGWPSWINIPSKVIQVASMRVLAREWKQQQQNFAPFVAAVCPGLVQTEASRAFFNPDDFAKAPTPEEAARPIVDLCLLPDKELDKFYGKLVQKRTIIPWR